MSDAAEWANDAVQHAAQNRKATTAEEAEIARLTGPRAAKQHSLEVERLHALHQDTSVKRPTARGVRNSEDDPRIQRARRRIRDGA